jgi:hypothetical protein
MSKKKNYQNLHRDSSKRRLNEKKNLPKKQLSSCSMSGHSTALPKDMWEKIIEQLPLPPPKTVPCIVFYKYTVPYAYWNCKISSAVSDEEYNAIVSEADLCGETDEDYSKSAYWRKMHRLNDEELDSIVTNANMFGFSFATETDRKIYECAHMGLANKGRYIKLLKTV